MGPTISRWVVAGLCLAMTLSGQSISPAISEYKGAAKSRFDIVNNTLVPVHVVLEAKSFSITPDGKGLFRPLDPGIHLKMSDMSFHLEPQRTHYVFYSVTAEQLPAWFTVYATFAPVTKTQGINVHIQLPHTVYLYSKKATIQERDVEVGDAHFINGLNQVAINVTNNGGQLGRAQEVILIAGNKKASSSGFPLLPSGNRSLALDWKEAHPPEFVHIRFPNFTMKRPIIERNK